MVLGSVRRVGNSGVDLPALFLRRYWIRREEEGRGGTGEISVKCDRAPYARTIFGKCRVIPSEQGAIERTLFLVVACVASRRSPSLQVGG